MCARLTFYHPSLGLPKSRQAVYAVRPVSQWVGRVFLGLVVVRASRRVSSIDFRHVDSAQPEPKVAKGRTFHDCLGAVELDLAVEPLGQREIALARQPRAQVCQSQGTIHLGITAPDDVERELFRGLLEDFQLQGAVFTPSVEGPRESLESVIGHDLGELGAAGVGEIADHLANNRQSTPVANLGRERLHERAHNACLDLSLFEKR